MKKIFKPIALSLIIISFAATNLFAQANIQEQYQEFYNESSTWEDYQMIKLNRMNEFWSVVTDSLNEKQQKINNSRAEINALNLQLAESKGQQTKAELALEESKNFNDSISFLGIQMSKTVYNIFVWLIIVALSVGMGSVFLMFKRSHTITSEAKKAYKDLEKENHDLREKARESQIKLKRELQTALNKLSEQRV